jgi:hypothetical protein
MTDQPQEYTPEELAAVKDQVQPPPVGVSPDPAAMAAAATGPGSPTEVDVNALLLQMQAQMAAMAAQITAMKAGQLPEGEHCLIGAAAQARDLIAHHFEFHAKGPDLTRLADDVLDAARNAVASGDTTAVRSVADKLRRRLEFFHPGPGDHHYFRQALGMVTVHIPDAADTVTQPTPSNAPAIGNQTGSAKVLQGSVTG